MRPGCLLSPPQRVWARQLDAELAGERDREAAGALVVGAREAQGAFGALELAAAAADGGGAADALRVAAAATLRRGADGEGDAAPGARDLRRPAEERARSARV